MLCLTIALVLVYSCSVHCRQLPIGYQNYTRFASSGASFFWRNFKINYIYACELMWCCMFTIKIHAISVLELFRWYSVLWYLLIFLCHACFKIMASKYREASPKYGSMLSKNFLLSTTLHINKPLLLIQTQKALD